ncbi:glycine-rich domain-containing protein [Bacillus niameyensis]|uniref:hypothetical protein n=1 Tax=Bacillus niameyensis TaxID=1522308 RepID=UPI000785F4BD|nr:hypothetical protein [Bacillus niameyensis]
MEIFIIAIIIIISAVAIQMIASRRRSKLRIEELPIPDNLGIQMEGLKLTVQDLDKALPGFYASDVKSRFMQEHPKVKDYEFEWVFFELKRYFIMNRLLKSVPMFSPTVDEIWHEMLMFTRDYDKFSQNFYGEVLHHTPNMEVTPIPGERGFFDWVYLSLFKSTPNSRIIWKGFLKNPIDPDIMGDFRNLTDAELLQKYFRNNEEELPLKKELIQKLKNEILSSEQMMKENSEPNPIPSSTPESQLFYLAAGAAVFYSLHDQGSNTFQDQMNDVIPNEYYKTSASSGGSTCSGFSCSSSSDSGGDSGGSSCSSCGGGCSS